MDSKKTKTANYDIEKNEITANITDSETSINEIEVIDKKEESFDFPALLQVIKFPSSKGPVVVLDHSIKSWCPAILLQSFIKGFFVLCFYHSMNQKLLGIFVNFGNSISKGLQNMSDELMNILVNTVIFNVSKIPFIGESISKAANNYLADYITLLATSVSTGTNDFLYDLYPAISLPEGIGFLMGIFSSLLGIGLSALVLKLFLVLSKHPFQSYPEIFSLLAIKSIITAPIIFVISILSFFFPIAGGLLLPFAMLYGMSYMISVLFKTNTIISENRIVYFLPIFIILILIVSILTVVIEGIPTCASIYVRLNAFFQTLQ